MKVLIVGSGGREHALAWKIAQSKTITEVIVAPGNAGTAQEAKVHNIPIDPLAIEDLLGLAKREDIYLTIIGPEAPLAAGIVDRFHAAGLRCFGPTQAAAQLESSKAFSKDFMQRHNIPTAAYQTFTELNAALDYVADQSFPLVIKADGLAAGKGVIIAQNIAQANQAIINIMRDDAFGQAGQQIIIEEFLTGEEVSFIVMSDGEYILPLVSSQDHKARDNGDQGPNTGGMGAYSPAPIMTPELHQQVLTDIMIPTIHAMRDEGHPYTGFLYAGLMISATGQPYVLEYNCRFGDPEAQPMMLRLMTDLVSLCDAALNHQLDKIQAEWTEQTALGVVLACEGYPGDYPTGEPIKGLSEHNNIPFGKVFHAGTTLAKDQVVTQGGRVLCVTALGETVEQAHQNAYQALQTITWPSIYFRTDIGHRAIAREQTDSQ
ncbi:MAG: phosphoribosylamine--glycine ligase [Legionellales bacterium]|nr:phosphoribosylamine--glycine ligase [Legionellales bacterium]